MVQTSGSQLDIQPQTSRRWSNLAELQAKHASTKAGKSLLADSAWRAYDNVLAQAPRPRQLSHRP